ncbi:MAG: ISAs1 family transposase [Nitrospiraceae bacterium]|nr:ISAs1 family transposase [Nitrospiraceae bacterium]
MTANFLDHIKAIEDHRVVGMITYPLDEVLLTTLVGLLCRAEDFDEIELLGQEQLGWLRQFLPFKEGIPQAQTFRKIFRLLDPQALERAFSSWVAGLQERISGVVAIDGKTLRGSKHDGGGKGALHLVSAYAHEAGLVIGQRAVDAKSNEITAIPELLDLLVLTGAIVTIDAMGTQKDIAAKIRERKADYVLALKGNQGTLHDDVKDFFDDPALSGECPAHTDTHLGHGRIEERVCRVAKARSWLTERHPDWADLTTIAWVSATRTDKKTGETSTETRFYISSLPPDPAAIAAACRSHWSIENNLHWQLDVTFREDDCRTRKDHAPLNFAIIRRAALNILKRDPTKMSLKRKRLKAALNPDFRGKLLAC